MHSLRNQLRHWARQTPERILLADAHRQFDAALLDSCLDQLVSSLQPLAGTTVAVVGDNSLAWVIADLALLELPVKVVPVPTFFSSDQIRHLLITANIQWVIGEYSEVERFKKQHQPDSKVSIISLMSAEVNLGCLACHCVVDSTESAAITSYEKVTFTSGSTGSPKGVHLSLNTLEVTAYTIAQQLQSLAIGSSLCVLPLSTLLENVAGVYAALYSGVTVHCRSLSALGFVGVSEFNIAQFLQQLLLVKPEAMILVPQLLFALTMAAEKGLPLPATFKFIAVGGGKVAPQLLERAEAIGLPVYEGYGLSECCSVVSLNLPGQRKIGSVGKPLPHVELTIENGEILVRDPQSETWIQTGDMGSVDSDGYLYVSGRKKNIVITAYGRNVNPEWVEAELATQLAIGQAAVFGEAMERLAAVLTPRSGFTWQQLQEAVASVNQRLPDYAKIHQLIPTTTPFSLRNGQLTANGRIRREAIEQAYALQLNLEKSHVIF